MPSTNRRGQAVPRPRLQTERLRQLGSAGSRSIAIAWSTRSMQPPRGATAVTSDHRQASVLLPLHVPVRKTRRISAVAGG
jgi:hypothetical protein